MEKIVEDAINSALPEEGQEQLSEGEKLLTGIKAKFQALGRTFYAPELVGNKKGGEKDNRSDEKSQKGSAASANEEGYSYVPLAPE